MAQSSPFARLVGDRRRESGMSVGRLAELVGRSPSTVRGWERGRAVPREPAVVEALAAALGLDEGELVAAIEATLDPGGPLAAPAGVAGSTERPAPGPSPTGATLSAPTGAVGTVAPDPVPLPPSYLEDPAERNAYRLRYALTAILLLVLFLVLGWSVRHLFATLGELWRAILDAYAG